MHGEGCRHRIRFDESLEDVGRRSGVVDDDGRGLALVQRQLGVQVSNLKDKCFGLVLTFDPG